MLDPAEPNPYTPPPTASGSGSEKRSSVLWTVPGCAVGAIVGACLIRRPDELFRDHSVIAMLLMLSVWGVIGLAGSLIWRLPRYWLWGPIRTPCIARFASGAMLFVTCILVLQMGRTRVIDLPEPAMGITMIAMLLTCVVGCVEFEAWYGRRV